MNALVTYNRAVSPAEWQTITSIAPAMHQARLFGVNSAEQAAAIMLTGYEVGFGLTAAFEFIHVVKGKPSISPRGMMALIHRSGELASFELEEVQKSGKFFGYRCRMTRKSGFSFEDSFTMDDARNADLLKDDSGWMKYPKNMCRWRVVGFVADVVFPDLLGGLKRADEYGATVDDRGDVVIEAPAASQPPFDSAEYIASLIQEYGADAVVAATGGDIPSDREGLRLLAIKLDDAAVEAEYEEQISDEYLDEVIAANGGQPTGVMESEWSDVAAELGGVALAVERELDSMVDEIVGSVEGTAE